MLNAERLIYLLLERGLPDITVVPDLDVDAMNHLPIVTFTVTGGSAVEGSPSPPTAWDANLSLSVFADDLDAAIALASQVYDVVWGWDDIWNGTCIIDELGHVAGIEDQAVFTRIGSVAIDVRTITQLNADFNLQVHQA